MSDLASVASLSAQRPRVVLFDLDRTLVDLFPDRQTPLAMRHTVLRILEERGVGQEDLQPFFPIQDGYTLWMKLASAWQASPLSSTLSDLDQVFLEAEINAVGRSELKAGAREILSALTALSVPTGVVTSNHPIPASKALEMHGLLSNVDVIIGRSVPIETERMKPSPCPIVAALKALHVDASSWGFVVGDSVDDMTAGTRAGLTPIGVETGDFGSNELRASGALHTVVNLNDLKGILLRQGKRFE